MAIPTSTNQANLKSSGELLDLLRLKAMSAREAGAILRRSDTFIQKYLRLMIANGDVQIDHILLAQGNGAAIRIYRASLPFERARFLESLHASDAGGPIQPTIIAETKRQLPPAIPPRHPLMSALFG